MGRVFTADENEQLLADIMPHLEAIKSLMGTYRVPGSLCLWFNEDGSNHVTAYDTGLAYFEWASGDTLRRSWEYSPDRHFAEFKEADGQYRISNLGKVVA